MQLQLHGLDQDEDLDPLLNVQELLAPQELATDRLLRHAVQARQFLVQAVHELGFERFSVHSFRLETVEHLLKLHYLLFF